MNIDFDDFPGPVCTDEDQLVKALEFKNYDYDIVSYFQIKYMVYTDGKNTSRVIDTINQIMEEPYVIFFFYINDENKYIFHLKINVNYSIVSVRRLRAESGGI